MIGFRATTATDDGILLSRPPPSAVHGERAAVFAFLQAELLSYEHDGDSTNPRLTHEVLLESDAYGNVVRRHSRRWPAITHAHGT